VVDIMRLVRASATRKTTRTSDESPRNMAGQSTHLRRKVGMWRREGGSRAH
jgi:hypothetical protein